MPDHLLSKKRHQAQILRSGRRSISMKIEDPPNTACLGSGRHTNGIFPQSGSDQRLPSDIRCFGDRYYFWPESSLQFLCPPDHPHKALWSNIWYVHLPARLPSEKSLATRDHPPPTRAAISHLHNSRPCSSHGSCRDRAHSASMQFDGSVLPESPQFYPCFVRR